MFEENTFEKIISEKVRRRYFDFTEEECEVELPKGYKKFLLRHNGGIPEKDTFECNGNTYEVNYFLTMTEDGEETDVIEKLMEHEMEMFGEEDDDMTGYRLIPIAETTAEDLVCLDYHEGDIPFISLWDCCKSEEEHPVTYRVADSFEEFMAMLH